MSTKPERHTMTGDRRALLAMAALLFALLLPGCAFKDNPPNTPAAPTGPTQVGRDSSYTYSAVTSDPDGDSIYFEFSLRAGSYDQSYWADPVASGRAGSVSIYWSYYSGTSYTLRVRALDAHGLYSDWSPDLSITVHDTNRTRTVATAQAQASASLYIIKEEPK
jgi:hypothetical protein